MRGGVGEGVDIRLYYLSYLGVFGPVTVTPTLRRGCDVELYDVCVLELNVFNKLAP